MKLLTTSKDKKITNRIYDKRYHAKLRLKNRAYKLIQRLYRNRPKGMTNEDLKLYHIRIASLISLPYRWTEEHYKRSENCLKSLEKSIFQGRYQAFSPAYENLLTELTKILENSKATVEEKATVLSELVFSTNLELEKQYKEQEPPIGNPLLFALTGTGRRHPVWVMDALVRLITAKFSIGEEIYISNTLYERLNCNLNTSTTALAQTEEEKPDPNATVIE